MRVLKQDIKALESVCTEIGKPMPTHVTDIYKNRSGENTYVRIWGNNDLGRMQFNDLFITDGYYNPIPLKDI